MMDPWAEMQNLSTIMLKGTLLHEVALEMTVGIEPIAGRDVGKAAAMALASLTNAIVRIAALNSNPRQILEYVVQLLDAADPSMFVEDVIDRCKACDHTLADHLKQPRHERTPSTACLRGTGDGSVCSCERYEAP